MGKKNIKVCKVIDLVNPNFAFTYPSIIWARGWLMLLCTQEYCSSVKSGVKSESHLFPTLCWDFSLLCCRKTEWVTDSEAAQASFFFFFFLHQKRTCFWRKSEKSTHNQEACDWSMHLSPSPSRNCSWTVTHPLCGELFLQSSTSHLFQLHEAVPGEV